MFSWFLMLWVAGLSHGLLLDQQTDPRVLQLLVKLKADVNDLKAKNIELEKLCTGKQSSTTQTPAFLATLSHNIDVCSPDTPIKFDHAVLNQGGSGYYGLGVFPPGVYRAPKNGTYQFSSTLSAPPYKRFYVAFVKNSHLNHIGYLYADSGLNSWQAHTTSIIVHLDALDDVWMSCLYDSSIGGPTGPDHTDYHSFFSGFMISED